MNSTLSSIWHFECFSDPCCESNDKFLMINNTYSYPHSRFIYTSDKNRNLHLFKNTEITDKMGDNCTSTFIQDEIMASNSSNSSLECETEVNSTACNKKLKIVSWNINGMRTLNMHEILKQLDAYIVMVQETKLTRKQLDQSQLIPPGYSSYFSFSNNKIGYSGVATFCRDEWTPSKAEEGLCLRNANVPDCVGCYPDLTDVDEGHVKFANADGRTVISQHVVQLPDGSQRNLTFINVYCPRLRDDPDEPTNNNTDFKLTFHELLHRRAQLLVESGSFVVLAGDINISHRWIDHCDGDPKTFVTTEFRKLLNDFLRDDDDNHFVDSFRMLYPDQTSAFTCWNTRLNARENNYGTRIDYIFVDKQLASYLENAEIHPEIFGSDHCPISVTFHSLQPVSNGVPPSFATKYYPEFKGKQTNLKEFMLTSSKITNVQTKINESETHRSTMPTKKRPLTHDSTTKVQCSKRIQTSLKSFFVRGPASTTATPLINTVQDVSSTVEETTGQSSLNGGWQKSYSQSVSNSSEAWKKLMKAPEVPLCKGHNVPCVKRTAKKKGINFGREFWSCSHGIGKSDDPNANCNFFQWVKQTTTKVDKQDFKVNQA